MWNPQAPDCFLPWALPICNCGASWDWGHGTGRQMFGEQAGLAHLTGFWSIQGESQKPAGAPFCPASHPITPFHPCMRVRCPHLSLLPSYCVEHWPTSRPQTTTHTSINLCASSQTPIISFYLRNLQQINFLQHLHLSRIWTIMLQSYQDKQYHCGSLISSGNRPKIIHG